MAKEYHGWRCESCNSEYETRKLAEYCETFHLERVVNAETRFGWDGEDKVYPMRVTVSFTPGNHYDVAVYQRVQIGLKGL